MVIDCVLAAEQRNGTPLTLGAAVIELVQNISEAARAIGSFV